MIGREPAEPAGDTTPCLPQAPWRPPVPGGEQEDAGLLAKRLAVPGHEILDVLGRGGMGIVFRARQLAPDRIVAMKILPESRFATTEGRQRFLREIRALSQLQTAHAVTIHQAGEAADGTLYYTMDYVEGKELDAHAADHGLGVPARLELFLQLCDGVATAHRQGVIHRDLKPSNILVDATGQIRILDLGLVKFADEQGKGFSLTRSGLLLGTPAYMAPEQWLGGEGKADTRADIYALGVILFQLLTDCLPYSPPGGHRPRSPEPRELEPIRLRALCPDLSRDLEAITLKAMAREPERRYQSVLSLADDLRRYLAHDPVEARLPTLGYRAGRFLRRRWAAVTVSACWLAVVATVLVLAFRRVVHERDEAVAAREGEAAARQAAAREAYHNELSLALHKLEAKSYLEARRILWRMAPEQRSWEWSYLMHLAHPETVSFDVPAAPVRMAASPDGEHLAVLDEQGRLSLWQLGGLAMRWERPAPPGTRLGFSPDGQRLLANGTVFAVADGMPEGAPGSEGTILSLMDGGRTLRRHGDLLSICGPERQVVRPVGRIVGDLVAWDWAPGDRVAWAVRTGRDEGTVSYYDPQFPEPNNDVDVVANQVRFLGPDHRLAIGRARDLRVWNATGTHTFFQYSSTPCTQCLDVLERPGKDSMVLRDAPEGVSLCLARYQGDGNPSETVLAKFPGRAETACFVPGRDHFAIASERTVYLFPVELAGPRGLPALAGHLPWARSADATFLASVQPEGLFCGMAAETDSARWLRPVPPAVAELRLSPAGRLLCVVGEHSSVAELYDVACGVGRAIPLADGRVIDAVRFSPDGLLLAARSRDGSVRVVRCSDGAVLLEPSGFYVGTMRFSPSSDLLLLDREGKEAVVWGIGIEAGPTILPSLAVRAACFTPDQTRVFLAHDHDVQVFRLPEGELVSVIQPIQFGGSPEAILSSRDGRRLFVGEKDGVSVWEVGTARRMLGDLVAGEPPVRLSWSRDNDLLVVRRNGSVVFLPSLCIATPAEAQAWQRQQWPGEGRQ